MYTRVIAMRCVEAACVPGAGGHPVSHKDLLSPELSRTC